MKRKLNFTSHRNRGASLIELLVVISIMMIVAAMILSTFARVYHIVQAWKH